MRRLSPLATILLLSAACGDDGGGGADGGSDASVDTDAGPAPQVPLDPDSPWPKFRHGPLQNGRADVMPTDDGSEPWVFETGKGIFSTPVIDGDGNVYVGSADRSFYKIGPDGSEVWRLSTGEIIDSSALLDDEGRVYFGSGDGHLYALDRETGEELWRFEADDPSVNDAFIRWFEGNVAMGADGTLFAPNDNFCTYAVDRETGERKWCFATADQTWSLPAVNTRTGRLFIGNNFLLGNNVFSVDADTGEQVWARQTGGTVAASPMLASDDPDGLVVLGGFDGHVRAFRQQSRAEEWSFGARDHVYASPGQLPDGTIVQPAADGTVYGLDPADGTQVWSFDTLEPIRSSPAIDATGNIYVGSGEGRLFVLNPDGTLRWAIRLIDEPRDDLNASPALGDRGVVVAGENGGVFFVPYDYCLRAGLSDDRCTIGPGEDLPDDGAFVAYTSRFGRLEMPAPSAIEANQPLAFTLFVREGGDTRLAVIDSDSVQVDVTPAVDVRVDVSGDRKFLVVVPGEPWGPAAGGTVEVRVRGDYLVDLDRDGLRFTGGTTGGSFDETFSFDVRARDEGDFALPFPAAPGDPSTVLEVYRLAAPLPTILPSYNQIGFDSIHYLVGVVEGDAGHAVAWGIGAVPAGDGGATVVDPESDVRFALELHYDQGLLTLSNEQGFTIEFNGFPLPFQSFRIATRIQADGTALESPAIDARAVCGDIDFYGPFLQRLGFCNPATDVLTAFGAADLRPHEGGVQEAPAGLGTVSLSATATTVEATFSGTSLDAADHNFGILLIDPADGRPVVADYVGGTEQVAATDGTVERVTLTFEAGTVPSEVRAHAMVDAYPAAVDTLTIP